MGSFSFASLGTKRTVCRRTPSRIGTMASVLTNCAGGSVGFCAPATAASANGISRSVGLILRSISASARSLHRQERLVAAAIAGFGLHVNNAAMGTRDRHGPREVHAAAGSAARTENGNVHVVPRGKRADR